MADIEWPADIVPFAQTFYLQPHVVRSVSPFTRQQKVYGLSQPLWVCRMSIRAGRDGEFWGAGEFGDWGARLDAFIAELEGGSNRVVLYDFLRQGEAGVTFSNEAIAAGDTEVVLDEADALAKGSYIGGDGRPHIVTSAENWGTTQRITVKPAFQSAVAAGEATYRRVTGTFRLTNDDAGDNETTVGEATIYNLEFVEDPQIIAEELALRRDWNGDYALVDYHDAQGLYAIQGTRYSSKAAFLAALGGVEDGSGGIIVGPYLSASNVITNDLDTLGDTSGWTATGSTISVVTDGAAPALQITKTGTGAATAYYQINAISRAFAFTAEVRRGTAATGSIKASANISPGLNAVNGTSNSSTSYATSTLIGASGDTGVLYVGGQTTGTATGTYFMKLPTAYEAWPFQGFTQAAFTVQVEGITPAAGSTTEVFLQLDANTARDKVRIYYNRATLAMGLSVTANNFLWTDFTQSKAAATPFAVAAGIANDDLDVSFDGSDVQHDTNTTVPGVALLRWFKSLTAGEEWSATKISRTTIYPDKAPVDFLRHVSASAVSFATFGDSYMAGASGAGSLRVGLETEFVVRKAVNVAIGGSTITDQIALVKSKPYLKDRTFIGWDGGLTGMTVQTTMDAIAELVAFLDHDRWMFLPPITPPPLVGAADPNNASFLTTEAIKAALIAEYGTAHIWDPIPTLQGLATASADDIADVAAGFPPRSLFALDGVHMPQTAHDAVANALEPFILAVEAL